MMGKRKQTQPKPEERKEPEKGRFRIKLGPVEIEGPPELVIPLLAGPLIGASIALLWILIFRPSLVIDSVVREAVEKTIEAQPTATATSVLTNTPIPTPTDTPISPPTDTPIPPPTDTPMPTPISLQIEGRVCEYYEDFNLLYGDRIFLRNAEFKRLGVPVGTKVTIAIIVDGVPTNLVPGLILDNDIELEGCVLHLRDTTRTALSEGIEDDGYDLEEDVTITPIADRPVRRFEIIVER